MRLASFFLNTMPALVAVARRPPARPLAASTMTELEAHTSRCMTNGCQCKTYVKWFDIWAKHCQLHPSQPEETWLWHKICPSGLKWICVACEGSGHASAHYKRRCMDKPEHLKFEILKEHHGTPCHVRAVAHAFNLEQAPVKARECHTAPSQQSFRELIEAFRKGGTPRAGFTLPSGIIETKKATSMLWVAGEALGEIRREAIVKSDCMTIMRDERHARMHVRYRCANAAGFCDADYFGQSIGHLTSSLGILGATKKVYKEAFTLYSHAPEGAAVKEQFDDVGYAHACSITEAIAVDTAENEIVGARDMVMSSVNGEPGPFPNCHHILRDGAHSARRVLSRLWKADVAMDNCFNFFCHWKESPGQMIHFSDEFRRVYAECTAESTSKAVDAEFSHLRAAKHRIETYLSPMSRNITDPDSVLGFAQKVTIIRKGEFAGKAMETFLWTVNADMYILAGMMSDGGVEAMRLIRFLDTEDVIIADIYEQITVFLDHVTWLFFEGGVFEINGHTSFIKKWYEAKPHHVRIGNNGRCFGGQAIREETLNAALSHMQSWVRLARHALDAEFPAFGVVVAFSAFALPRNSKFRATAIPDEKIVQVRRLATTFDKQTLLVEYKQCWHHAAAYYANHPGCSYWDAWRAAVKHVSCEHVGRIRQLAALQFVAARGECYTPSTSGVEQSFSRVDSILGKNRLLASPHTESLSIALISCSRFHNAAAVADITDRCVKIWRLAFLHHSRTHFAPRVDKGVTRTLRQTMPLYRTNGSTGLPTEKGFLKRLRDEVVCSAPTGCSSLLSSSDGLCGMFWKPLVLLIKCFIFVCSFSFVCFR